MPLSISRRSRQGLSIRCTPATCSASWLMGDLWGLALWTFGFRVIRAWKTEPFVSCWALGSICRSDGTQLYHYIVTTIDKGYNYCDCGASPNSRPAVSTSPRDPTPAQHRWRSSAPPAVQSACNSLAVQRPLSAKQSRSSTSNRSSSSRKCSRSSN